MLINPRKVLENGWVIIPDGVDVEKCVQPNAIDWIISDVYEIISDDVFVLSETEKHHRNRVKLDTDDQGYWVLEAGKCYDISSSFYANIPDGACAELIVRSTLNRNGVKIFGGLYDSKYSGAIGAVLYNPIGITKIQRGTRVGQIKFITSDSEGGYSGGYNHDQNTRWHE